MEFVPRCSLGQPGFPILCLGFNMVHAGESAMTGSASGFSVSMELDQWPGFLWSRHVKTLSGFSSGLSLRTKGDSDFVSLTPHAHPVPGPVGSHTLHLIF